MRSSSFSSYSFFLLSCSCLFMVRFRLRLSGFRRPDSNALPLPDQRRTSYPEFSRCYWIRRVMCKSPVNYLDFKEIRIACLLFMGIFNSINTIPFDWFHPDFKSRMSFDTEFFRISMGGTPLRYIDTASIWISFENIRKPHELDLLQLMGFSSQSSWLPAFL